MLLRLLSLVCLIFVSQLSLTQQSGSARTHVPSTCPVTQVSKPPFVALSSYPAKAGGAGLSSRCAVTINFEASLCGMSDL